MQRENAKILFVEDDETLGFVTKENLLNLLLLTEEGKTIPDSSRQDMHKPMTNMRPPVLMKRP